MSEFKSFSPKQQLVLSWWCPTSRYCGYDAVICDGAVRSGKTVCMSLSFVLWAFTEFDRADFAICSKTVTALNRNIVMPLIERLEGLGFATKHTVSKNYLDVSLGCRSNRFYLFGGKDEGSAGLIQGITLSGVLLDEVALMPKSFVEQALARCSVEGSRFWFSCNPDNPSHWFYREWIKKAKQKNALYLHFTMDDNPSLSERLKARYKRLYHGVFYDRFILGKWVATEGAVYPFFDIDKHCFSIAPCEFEKYYISCDYGTVNPCSMGLWGLKNGTYYRINEFYWDSKATGVQKTDEEYCDDLEKLADGKRIEAVVVDPSAASFIAALWRPGRFEIVAADNDVVNGIRCVANALKNRRILFWRGCEATLREFGLYRWESRGLDRPEKKNDHAMDDIRYFVTTVAERGEDDCFAVFVNRNSV